MTLTLRQRQVLQLVCQGESTKRIAAQLGLAESVIKTHIRHARQKLGAKNRAHAAALFVLQ